jgi:SAM-dependent methyltransferase
MKLRKKVRKLVRGVPVLGAFAKTVRDNVIESEPRRRSFPGSRAYWEERYASGGNSGVGSYSKFAEFKAEVLNDFVATRSIDTVIEFGCGDGNQLLLAEYARYLGFDVSATAVDVCRRKFSADSSKSFRLLDLYAGETADLTLSLDVIYHLIEDEEFDKHMRMLFAAATRFVIIYSSNTDRNEQKSEHLKHREFTRWIEANAAEWSLDCQIKNRFPYAGDHKKGSFADFYIYKKMTAR